MIVMCESEVKYLQTSPLEVGLGEEVGPDHESGSGEEAGSGKRGGTDKEADPQKAHGAGKVPGPGEETAEQRRQRRRVRELALRALV